VLSDDIAYKLLLLQPLADLEYLINPDHSKY